MAFREPVLSEHVQKILKWQGTLLKQDENHFFETIRMYLGEIKSPFNKQNLISQLESFLRKKENQSIIKSFVTPKELEIICAVVFIPDATEDKLTSFFENTYSYSFIYETLQNLEERLIIFKYQKDDEYIIEFNPFLEDAFYDLIKVEKLLTQPEYKAIKNDGPSVSPELIACIVSFILENPNLAKQDGTLKKHTVEIAGQIFGPALGMLSVIYTSFLNLGILKEKSKGVEFDWNKFSKFTEQSFAEQIIYIIVSSAGHFSRDSLRLQAQVFIDAIQNLKGVVFTKDLFLRTGFLAAARPKEEAVVRSTGGSRFARMIEEGRARMAESGDNDAVRVSTSGGLERMFQAAVLLGVLKSSGITGQNEDVFSIGEVIEKEDMMVDEAMMSAMLTVDPGMGVSLMPGFRVRDIVPVARFMEVKRFDTVSSFVLSKQSVMRGFDAGLDGEKILSLLTERTRYGIPDSLSVQIDDWHSVYSSASFYHGYVLKLDGKASQMAEHNSVFAPHIHTVIAPGVFLLDVTDDAQALALLKDSGLDSVGKIKTAVFENQSSDFLKLSLTGRQINDRTGFEIPKEEISTVDADKIEKDLIHQLDKLNLDDQQRDTFEMRIHHKVILSAQQLDPRVLRLERVNAETMDFAGKIYVIEQAIKANENVEISYGAGGKKIVGQALAVNKRTDDAYVDILLLPENVVREFALGKASLVRRIRKSIYRS